MLTLLAAGALYSAQMNQLADYGKETLEFIQTKYVMADGLYGDSVTATEGPKAPAFNWGVGVMLTALSAAAEYDPSYKDRLRTYADAGRAYWNPEGPVAGYDVLPVPKPVDRYYDDNEWMVMGLVETYEVLGDQKYLDWAQETLKYVYSGEDSKLGGGIYWRESDKKSKNTCSNAPAVAATLAVFHHTKNSRHLRDAIRIYGWTKKNLLDKEDNLFFDGMNLEGGIGKAKWSYNTGLMIRSAADLFVCTKNPQYLADVKAFQTASAKKWLVNGTLADEGRFAHLLLESWIYQRKFAPVPNPNQATSDTRAFSDPLTFLHDKGRDANGFYGKRFDAPPASDQTTFELIDQASAARAYYKAALYFRSLAK
jgi:rhamnogalacturonyl hydrolase YesR